jgi:multisubunit Na+/H+ antiporter MnhC subunit
MRLCLTLTVLFAVIFSMWLVTGRQIMRETLAISLVGFDVQFEQPIQ